MPVCLFMGELCHGQGKTAGNAGPMPVKSARKGNLAAN
jgi:hypothetical protein